MRIHQIIKFFIICALLTVATSCSGQRSASTSSARAAYGGPSSNWYKKSSKTKKTKMKPNRTKKSKKPSKDAARERRKGIGM